MNNKLDQLKRAVILQRLQQRNGTKQISSIPLEIVPAARGVSLALSWAQQRLWFLDQLDHAAGSAYHMPAGLKLTGRLKKEALQANLDRIVSRHESLRTTFVSVNGEATQVIGASESGFALSEQGLSELSG